MANTILPLPIGVFNGDSVPVTAGDLPAYHDVINGRAVLVFPDGSDEYAAVTQGMIVPQAYAGGALSLKIAYFSTATSGNHDIEAYVEAITSGDTVDLDSATSFDSANATTLAAAATAGYMTVGSITLTNKDSIAAGDLVRVLIRRDADDAGDNASGTFYLIAAELQE